MRLLLVADVEQENLGIGYVAAAAARFGHDVDVISLHSACQVGSVAKAILARAPAVVGLSLQYQHAAPLFFLLARLLRRLGFQGHMTCGGHVASLAWQKILASETAIDSVVMYEAEETLPDMLSAIDLGADLHTIEGLAMRDLNAQPQLNPRRPMCWFIDDYAEPVRLKPASPFNGIEVIPMLWSRGCWGSCSFCSVSSFYRGLKGKPKGSAYRQRHPENVVREMSALVTSSRAVLFDFYDDTFLLPKSQDSLARLMALQNALREEGLTRVAFAGACRPDSLDETSAKDLFELGVIALEVGIKNTSARVLDDMQRRIATTRLDSALSACRSAGICASYSLQLLYPGSTLEDVTANLDFIAANADHVVDVTETRAVYGTPLWQQQQSVAQTTASTTTATTGIVALKRFGDFIEVVLRSRRAYPSSIVELSRRATVLSYFEPTTEVSDLAAQTRRLVAYNTRALHRALRACFEACQMDHADSKKSDLSLAMDIGLELASEDIQVEQSVARLLGAFDALTLSPKPSQMSENVFPQRRHRRTFVDSARGNVRSRDKGRVQLLETENDDISHCLCCHRGQDCLTALAQNRNQMAALSQAELERGQTQAHVERELSQLLAKTDELPFVSRPTRELENVSSCLQPDENQTSMRVRVDGLSENRLVRYVPSAGEIQEHGGGIYWVDAPAGASLLVGVLSPNDARIFKLTKPS